MCDDSIQKTNLLNLKKLKITWIEVIALILMLLTIISTIYIGWLSFTANYEVFSIATIALILGVLVESYRISKNLKAVLLQFGATYILSILFSILDIKNLNNNMGQFMINWQIKFLIIYLIISLILYDKKITPKLTEGITLILSISLIYWMLDFGVLNFSSLFYQIISVLAIFFTFFSVIHALLNIKLNKTSRLWLSIWSTIAMLIFSIDNAMAVFDSGKNMKHLNFSHLTIATLQHFFLGISAVYIFSNLLLIAGFLPSKHTRNYRKDLKETMNLHLNRYSNKQVESLYAILCLLFLMTIFGLNYKYQILPRNIMIWLAITISPIFLLIINKLHIRSLSK